MKRKILAIVLLLALTLTFTPTAFAADNSLVGFWSGNVSAMGMTFPARAAFTKDNQARLVFATYDLTGGYALRGNKIDLIFEGGPAQTLDWSLKKGVLTIGGLLVIPGFQDVPVPVEFVATKDVAKVTKMKAPKVAFGKETTITVTTNDVANCVKVTDQAGRTLAQTNELASANTFVLKHTFESTSTKVYVYAGILAGADVVWGPKKNLTVKVGQPAASTKLISVKASANKLRVNEYVTLTITTNNKTTRVKVEGANTVITDKYTTKGKNRVFKVKYTQKEARKQIISVYPGDQYGFKIVGKTVTVQFRK